MERLGFTSVKKQAIVNKIGEQGLSKALEIGTIEEVRPGYYKLTDGYRKKIVNSLTDGIDVSVLINHIEEEKILKCQGQEFYREKLKEMLDGDTLFYLRIYKKGWEDFVLLMFKNNTENFLTEEYSFTKSPYFFKLRQFCENVPVIEYLQRKIDGEKTRKTFRNYINLDTEAKKDRLIDELKLMCNQIGGQSLARIVIALQETDLLYSWDKQQYFFDAMKKIFPSIGVYAGFNDQYRKLSDITEKSNSYLYKEIQRSIKYFRNFKKTLD